MPSIPETLREIHRLRRFARDLQQEIDRGPYQIKARRALLTKAEEAYRATQDALKQLKVHIHEHEVSLKATHQQIAKYERQLDEAGDKKQYDALKTEIAAARQTAAGLEDKILEGMAAAEERTTKLPEQERAARSAKDDLAAFERDHAERLARLGAELKGAMAQLKQVEENIPEQVRAHYQRLVNAHGADALAAVEGHACANCRTQITIQQVNDVECGEFVCCRSCGRVLYRAA